MTDAGVVHLETVEKLRKLNLALTQVTSRCISSLEKRASLTWLSLANTATRGGTRAWRLSRLRSLDLRGTDFTRSDVARLSGLKHLRLLDLTHATVAGDLSMFNALTRLETLRLGHTNVDTSGPTTPLPFPQLKVLELYGTRIDKRLLKRLSRCRQLKKMPIDMDAIDGLELRAFDPNDRISIPLH